MTRDGWPLRVLSYAALVLGIPVAQGAPGLDLRVGDSISVATKETDLKSGDDVLASFARKFRWHFED